MVVTGGWDVVVGGLHALFDSVEKCHGGINFFLRGDEFYECGASVGPGNSEQLFCLFQVSFFVLARNIFSANGALPQEEVMVWGSSLSVDVYQILATCFHGAKTAIHFNVLKCQAILRLAGCTHTAKYCV